jgi:HPt (histidine-containing phosphotransfer) domain-containing protein
MSSSLDPDIILSLRNLEAESEPGFVAQIYRLFLDGIPQRMDRMKAAMAIDDRKMIASEAHAMKSSAGNIGALKLSQLCQNLEGYARSTDPAGRADSHRLLEEFNAEILAVMKEIRQLSELR